MKNNMVSMSKEQFQDMVKANTETKDNISRISRTNIKKALDLIPILKPYFNEVESMAVEYIKEGFHIPGYTLGNTYTRNKCKSPYALIKELNRVNMRPVEDTLIEDGLFVEERKFLPAYKIKKYLIENDFEGSDIVKDYFEKEVTGSKVVVDKEDIEL